MKWARRLVWAAVLVAGVAAYAAHRMSIREAGAVEGHLGQVPAFTFTNQAGGPVSARDFKGKVWIVNFVFTRCASVCPMLTAKFRGLQQDLRDVKGVAFVSISVDPDYDTPSVLAAYAKRFQADVSRWQFLTGPLTEIERVVVKGFKIHIGERPKDMPDPTLMEIMHGEHLVLVDQQGAIRGYFRSDQAGLDELATATRNLIKQ